MLDVKRALKAAQVPARTHPLPLSTPWGEAITAAGDNAPILPEHPRPTMQRAAYAILNGMWECAFSPLNVSLPARSARDARVAGTRPGALNYDEALHAVSTATPPITFGSRIRVPFSPEAPLSGVNRVLQPNELLWYRRMLELPVLSSNDRLILHFEAVDWVCAVYVNGQLAKTHRGGYLPFDVDATPHLCPASEGRAELMLCVYDPSDAGVQPRGKQSLTPGGIWYSAQSGIWQNVWYEVVPATHLTSLSLNGAADGSLTVCIPLNSRLVLEPTLAARALIGPSAPFIYNNVYGGALNGRYLDQQIAFNGLSTVEQADRYFGTFGLKLRQRIGGHHYVTGAASYGVSADELNALLRRRQLVGVSLTYGYDSFFGPLEATLNYFTPGHSVSLYINLGLPF